MRADSDSELRLPCGGQKKKERGGSCPLSELAYPQTGDYRDYINNQHYCRMMALVATASYAALNHGALIRGLGKVQMNQCP